MDLLSTHGFVALSIGHLENTDSMSYEVLPNIDHISFNILLQKSH